MGNEYTLKEEQKSKDSVRTGGHFKNAAADKSNNNGISSEIRKNYRQSLMQPVGEDCVNYHKSVYSEGIPALTITPKQCFTIGGTEKCVIQRKPLKNFTQEELFDLSPFFSGTMFDDFLAECSQIEVDDNDPLNYIRSAFREYCLRKKIECKIEKISKINTVHRDFTEEGEFSDKFFDTYFGSDNPNYGGQTNYLGYVSGRTELQLGFRSIALLKAVAGGYQLIKVVQCHGETVKNISFEDLHKARQGDIAHHYTTLQTLQYNQMQNTLQADAPRREFMDQNVKITCVFTKSVSGCTFAAMCDADKEYIMVMHLDQDTPVSVDRIRELLAENGKTNLVLDSIFVSKVDGEEEAAKVRVIEDSFGEQRFGVSSIPQTTILERGSSSDVYAQRHDIIGLELSEMNVWGTMGSSEKEIEKQVTYILSCTTKRAAEEYIKLSVNSMLDAFRTITTNIEDENWDAFRKKPDFRAILLSLYKDYAHRKKFTYGL